MATASEVLRRKLEGAALQVPQLPRAFALLSDAAGGWTLAWLALLVAQGILPAAVVMLAKPVVDGIGATLRDGAGSAAAQATLALAAVLAVLLLVSEALRAAADAIRGVQARSLEDHVIALLHAKPTDVDVAFYDHPEYHQHPYRA